MKDAELVEYYHLTESIRACAKHFGASIQTVRRRLIHAGAYTSAIAEQINSMYDAGYTPQEIAALINCTVKSVMGYIPYTKCRYRDNTPTINAIRIKAFRERKRQEMEDK